MSARYPHSYYVHCLNCGITWERIIPSAGTWTEDIQVNCPACGSNAFRRLVGDQELVDAQRAWKLAQDKKKGHA